MTAIFYMKLISNKKGTNAGVMPPAWHSMHNEYRIFTSELFTRLGPYPC